MSNDTKRRKTRYRGISYRERKDGTRTYSIYWRGNYTPVEGGENEALPKQAVRVRDVSNLGMRPELLDVPFKLELFVPRVREQAGIDRRERTEERSMRGVDREPELRHPLAPVEEVGDQAEHLRHLLALDIDEVLDDPDGHPGQRPGPGRQAAAAAAAPWRARVRTRRLEGSATGCGSASNGAARRRVTISVSSAA